MFNRQCIACKVKDEQIAYLQKMVDRLQAKFGIAPVIQKPSEEKEEKAKSEGKELIDNIVGEE